MVSLYVRLLTQCEQDDLHMRLMPLTAHFESDVVPQMISPFASLWINAPGDHRGDKISLDSPSIALAIASVCDKRSARMALARFPVALSTIVQA